MTALVVVLALLAGAARGPVLDEAAGALKRDPVFVHPDADPKYTLSGDEAGELRDKIQGGSRPVFVAILPTSAEEEAGGLDRLPASLGDLTNLRGTYAVVTGKGFRAASNDLAQGAAPAAASGAFQARRQAGSFAVLDEFVTRVQAFGGPASGNGSAGESGQATPDRTPGFDAQPANEDGGGSVVLPLVLVGGATAGGVYLLRKRRRQQVALESVLSGDREDLRAELAVVADDVMRLEPEVSIHPEAREDYDAGVARYKWAQAAVEGIDSPDDVPRVRRALAEAAYAMARAQAIVRGDEPPPPPAELSRPGSQGEPAVQLDQDRRPVYAGYGDRGYDGGGWGGGGFFGGNGLFTGLMIGQMLGGGFGWGGGYGWGGGGHDHHDSGSGDSSGDGGGWSGGDDSGGGGDWGGGGGDWGGGGGDFGGGDVGGGDWG